MPSDRGDALHTRDTGDRVQSAWARRHETALLIGLVALATVWRAVLVWRSPTPYGYVYDFYHEAIQRLYATGHLPAATDCWQCYQPPLFALLGLPFYALGKHLLMAGAGLNDPALRVVGVLPLTSGAVTAYYSYRLLRFADARGTELVVGTGLVLAFPCLFISSYGLESDILLTALMTAFFYYMVTFLADPAQRGRWPVVRLGVLAGLACETKYSGLLAPVIFLVAGLLRAAQERGFFKKSGFLTVLLICALVGSWKYVDNERHYQTPLFANGSAEQGFTVSDRPSYWDHYDFSSFRLGALILLVDGKIPPARLTTLPMYRSVWTTLYAMSWGDMTFFSDPSRHGANQSPYPRKHLNPTLATTVLVLGLVPTVLALVGFVESLRDRTLWPLAIACLFTLAAYLIWVTAQESWALKTKYILFLLSPGMLYVLLGWRAIGRVTRTGNLLVLTLLVLLLIASHLYLLDFAWS